MLPQRTISSPSQSLFYQAASYTDWKNKVIEAYDSADSEWRRTKLTTGHLMSYHHYGQSNVLEEWTALTSDVETFANCTSAFFNGHRSGAQEEDLTPRPCSRQNDKLNAQMEKFRSVVETGRPFFWEGK
jgi:hypothetical protein